MRLLSRHKKTTSYDARWFGRLQQLLDDAQETYIALMPAENELARKRRQFEASDYTLDINLHARHLDPASYESHIAKLQELRRDIETDEPNTYIRQAYGRVISEVIAKHTACIASARGDDEAFRMANLAAYGEPDIDIFRGAIQWIRSDAAATAPSSPLLAALRDDALTILPPISGNTRQFLPSQATYEWVQALHHMPGGYMTRLFGKDGVPSQPTIRQPEGDELCRQILARIGADYQLADAHDGAWSMRHETRQVLRPRGYELNREVFIGIVCHEIGSHLLERLNGASQPLLLLQTGLDRYEHGNEGRALLREQIVHPSHTDFLRQPAWEYGVLKHVLIGLAEGLSEQPYDFSEVYNVAYTLYAFWRERRYPGAPDNLRRARDEAWHITIRVLKGTGGHGGAYTKDIVYLEGNIRCWRVARRHPEMILYGDFGKFDIANADHIELLRRLGILRPRSTTAKTRAKQRLRSLSRLAVMSTRFRG